MLRATQAAVACHMLFKQRVICTTSGYLFTGDFSCGFLPPKLEIANFGNLSSSQVAAKKNFDLVYFACGAKISSLSWPSKPEPSHHLHLQFPAEGHSSPVSIYKIQVATVERNHFFLFFSLGVLSSDIFLLPVTQKIFWPRM